MTAKEFWKTVNIRRCYEILWLTFMDHPVLR